MILAKPLPPTKGRVAPQGQAARAPVAVERYFRHRASEERAMRVLAAAKVDEVAKIDSVAKSRAANPEVGAADPEAGSEIVDSV